MNINESYQHLLDSLFNEYERDEAETMSRFVFEDVFELKASRIVLDAEKEFSNEHFETLNKIIERLNNHEPLQYVTGKAFFYGNEFDVTPAVLIPRPETEELVDWIVKSCQVPGNSLKKNIELQILDIGTGSGCIAISLKENIPHAEIYALDISEAALLVAKKNANKLNQKIHFVQTDILTTENPFQIQFDLIVSNPPYIAESEFSSLDKNVIAFEPHEALFAKGEDPLIFYRKIIEFAQQYLNENGKLFFEINQQFGYEVLKLLQENSFKKTELRMDINGNNRFVCGVIIKK